MDRSDAPPSLSRALRGVRWGLVAALLAGGAACRSPLAAELKRDVTPGLAFAEVIADPGAFTGSVVLWGGIILETNVHADGTRLEILHRPLDPYDQPQATDDSEGRFLVERPGAFLDPAVYAQGREVTVIGTITGEQERPLGEVTYHYPVVEAQHLILWPQRVPLAPYPYYGYGYSCDLWGYPYGYGPPYRYGYGIFGHFHHHY